MTLIIEIMNVRRVKVLLTFLVILCLSAHPLEAQLSKGFHNDTCPQAESIVRKEVFKAFLNDSGLAAGLVRMHFHNAFVTVSISILSFFLYIVTFLLYLFLFILEVFNFTCHISIYVTLGFISA